MWMLLKPDLILAERRLRTIDIFCKGMRVSHISQSVQCILGLVMNNTRVIVAVICDTKV